MKSYIANYSFGGYCVDPWFGQKIPNTYYRFSAEDDLEALKIADEKLKEISRKVINACLDSLLEVREVSLDSVD